MRLFQFSWCLPIPNDVHFSEVCFDRLKFSADFPTTTVFFLCPCLRSKNFFIVLLPSCIPYAAVGCHEHLLFSLYYRRKDGFFQSPHFLEEVSRRKIGFYLISDRDFCQRLGSGWLGATHFPRCLLS